MKHHDNKSILFRALCTAGVLLGAASGLQAQVTGPSTSFAPYLVPTAPGVTFTSLRAVEDGTSKGLPQMVGIPDGLGAYDNGNGTFTILMNHELGNTAGNVRDHGARGSFVSQWVVDKSTLEVKSVTDLVKTVSLWNGAGFVETPAVAFARLCSADLPSQSAFQFGSFGTSAGIFMNGEESGAEARAFGHVATGPNAGKSYELPALGKFSWENSVANPLPQKNTIVAGLDDSGGGQVYFYLGEKKSSGNDVEKAGLTGGNLFGLKISGLTTEVDATSLAANATFTLAPLGNVTSKSGATLQNESVANGVTGFQRPEDGAWNPANPNEFYFVTTDGSAPTDRSRLWRMTFDDLTNLSLGGKAEMLLDGTEGQLMFDNITISPDGKKVLLQEDPGGNARLAKIWQYDIATDGLSELAQHSPLLFSTTSVQGNFRFNWDEESSGIIPLWDILGPGYYALDVQAHTASALAGAVENGQLLIMFTPVPEVTLPGTLGVGAVAVAGIMLRRRRSGTAA